MFKNMSVKNRLYLMVLIAAIAGVMGGAISVYGIIKTNNNFIEFTKTDFQSNNQARNAQSYVNKISDNMFGMVISDNPVKTKYLISSMDANKILLTESIKKLKAVYDGDKKKIERFETELSDWSKICDKVISEIKDDDKFSASKTISNESSLKLDAITTTVESIVNGSVVDSNNTIKQNQNVFYTSLIVIMTLMILGITLTLFFGISSIKNIIYPLEQIEKACGEMARGNLQVKINYKSRNEIGKLAESMRDSIQILHNYVWDIEATMTELSNGNFDVHSSQMYLGDFENIQTSINKFILTMSEALEQITEASDQVLSGSEQVSDAAQTLAQGATEQSSSVEEISATINNVSQQVTQNAFNANEASKKSNDTSKELTESNQQMLEMISAMNDITAKSREIGSIVSTIDNIAFQTNILALNAAVEAARVGAAGKGFAVVAGEVRNLAVKSAEAAKNTSRLVEESIHAVETGSRIANNASVALKQTVVVADESLKLINSIAQASNEQAAAIAQVNSGINQISSVVQTNSATSEETAAASEELSGQANLLKDVVSKFKLYDESEAQSEF